MHIGKPHTSAKVSVPLDKVFVIIHSSNGYSKIRIEDSPILTS